ncbi:hypothetical protein HZF24_14380 [Sedimentibacter hydroxybenzoicus DSM 7310]|uniref:Uncharacterized protein n=1 Tax=Sedimentibacter hydroxybenzoicus DSM 7310 TaxID=1123245 RepID=A0A974BM33_SEDHY|nr:hypothetical protein [Sedimentibacter hydroxybenzoicus]NYB75331.1 hypothetical protein [Sedimentibacter hydroxybenzoicus DSM 7310]
MDMEVFFKRVYTVAFRLTGDKEIAAEMAAHAITHTVNELDEDYKITEDLLQLTIIELVKIFLNVPKSHRDHNLKGIQKALLELKPINRAVLIWKDVLGYRIYDNIPVSDCTHEELFKELVHGRKMLKEYISM